jgi:hypothetical protein
MVVQFVGGPYDGREIDQDLIDRFAEVRPVRGDVGARFFVLMPPPEDWARLVRGEEVRPQTTYPYERCDGPDSTWFQTVPAGAFDRAVSESRLKVHS